MKELRTIDFSKEKYFECGGKKFFVTESLSFTRWRELQKISLEFGYSATFEQIFNNLKSAVESYDKHEYFNMSVTLYKIMEGIKRLDDKDDPALRLCALFINEENEDPTKYSDAMMKAKIDCWAEELAVDPFFLFGYESYRRMDASLSDAYPKWFGKGKGKPGKPKTIAEEIKDLEGYWIDLIYWVCDKDPGKMRDIVSLDVFEFFGYVDRKKNERS